MPIFFASASASSAQNPSKRSLPSNGGPSSGFFLAVRNGCDCNHKIMQIHHYAWNQKVLDGGATCASYQTRHRRAEHFPFTFSPLSINCMRKLLNWELQVLTLILHSKNIGIHYYSRARIFIRRVKVLMRRIETEMNYCHDSIFTNWLEGKTRVLITSFDVNNTSFILHWEKPKCDLFCNDD